MSFHKGSAKTLIARDAGHHYSKRTQIIVTLVIVLMIIIPTVAFLVLRRVRRYHYEPKLVPGSYLKRKWQEWIPRGTYSKVSSRRHGRGDSVPTEYAPNPIAAEEARATNAAAAGVDRNTSVRSVMTLPAYSSAPKPTEQVIGREGERGGMDVVAEYPETVEEEEGRRDEEMESLYQIRLARRQEIADREARRQARREARERGDFETLDRLRRESRARAHGESSGDLSVSAATMLAEHRSRGRERRVSAVAYGSVGLVRHDGTRLRSSSAHSADSERGGLLEGAAPMADERPSHSRATSRGSIFSSLRPSHDRTRSGSSALSISTTATDVDREGIFIPPGQLFSGNYRQSGEGRSSNSSDSTTAGASLSPAETRYTPEPSSNSEGDIGDNAIPPPVVNPAGTEPPDYDNLDWGAAPPYSSPIREPGQASQVDSLERQIADRSIRQGSSNSARTVNSRSGGVTRIPTLPPQLPQLRTFPSIRVHTATEPNTPASPVRHD